MVRLVIIIFLVALHALLGTPQFFLGGSPYLLRAATYSFFHASWWHLAVNCIAIWSIFRPIVFVEPRKYFRVFAVAYIIAILVYPLSFKPVIGFSNVLYAILGLNTPPLSNPWWRQASVVVFLAVTVALICVPVFSTTTHIASFLLGMGCAAIGRCYQDLLSDAGRYLR